jgi:hypothetical protein
MENMRKIVLTLDTGYAGMRTHEGWLINLDATDDDIFKLADERAVEHAEMYGIYRLFDDEEESGDYSGENIEGSWEEYVPEKHDGKLIYGANSKISWNEY